MAYQTWPYEAVRDYIAKAGHELLTPKDEYKDHRTILRIRCPEGHVYKNSFNKFKNQGCRCCDPSCIREKVKKLKS